MKFLLTGKAQKITAIFTFLLIAAIFAGAQKKKEQPSKTFSNPLITVQDSADPWMFYHKGFYYFTATLDPNGGVWLWRAKTLAGLNNAEKKQVYKAPESGLRSKQIWAPELHHFDKRWFFYFTASDGTDENHRMHVLESKSDDPWSDYEYKAKVFDETADEWAIDGTVFRHENGKLYMIWCGHVPDNGGNGLYISEMRDPWTLFSKRVLISKAVYNWEKVRYPINEAPEILQRGGKIFLIYSASDTGTPDYALGMLENSGGDVLEAKNWKKHPTPIFFQSKSNNGAVFGPGHNGFFKSPDGKEDWIVYHAKETDEYTYRGRRARAQKFAWKADGTPDFGIPVPADKPVRVPSGEIK